MRELAMIRGAKTLIETCANVKPGENVVVVTDFSMMNIGQVIVSMAYAAGAKTDLIVTTPRPFDGQEPTDPVSAALANCDVFFAVVDRSLTHTHAVQYALRQGARGIMLTGFTEEMLISGGLEADFHSLAPKTFKVASAIEDASIVHLTSNSGTNLVMSTKGQRANTYTCIVKPGEFSPVPNVEANIVPVENSAQGVIVVDGSIPYEGIGLLKEPIKIEVEDGLITSISGGIQASRLADTLEKQNDPLVYVIAELGIGLNPHCRLIGCMLEDQGVYGTVHIGIGTNVTLGGTVKANSHYDFVLRNPTLVVDGHNVVKDGEVILARSCAQ